MIGLSLWLSAAIAAPPASISEDRKAPTTVWLVEDAVPIDSMVVRDCKPRPEEGQVIPGGLRGRAHLLRDACGVDWVFLDLDVETGARANKYATVRLDQVSLTPPKHAGWERLSDGPTRYVYGARDYPEPAVSLDRPLDEERYWLGSWEPVTVLDPTAAIIRTQGGRVLQVSNRWLEEAPRFLPSDKERYLEHLGFFQAGRVARETAAGAPLRGIRPSSELVERARDLQGHSFVLEIEPESLHSPQYAEWLEPVGQVHERACPKSPGKWEACGAYYLDYTAFGAWRPDKALLVVGVLDGTQKVDGRALPRLRVMVRDPFGDRIQVAPAWDQ